MFCSKCGKTLPLDAVQCPFCGLTVGESRFEGSPYTSAQSHILPGDDVRRVFTQNYTRTNYMSTPNASDQGDVDARTTYRPSYNGDSIPEEMRRDIRAARQSAAEPEPQPEITEETLEGLSEDAANSLNAVDDELHMEEVDYSQFRARPIESSGQTGISSDVSEMMQELDYETPRRSSRRRKAAPYGDYEDLATDEGSEEPAGDDQAEVFDDIDDEEFDELRHGNGLGVKQIIKIVIILVVVAVLFVAGVMWVRYIRTSSNSTTIEDVNEDLYTQGIELIETHASSEYTTEILEAYTASDSSLTDLYTLLDESTAEVEALLADDATETEQLFVEALEQIQSNIVNCIITDALAVSTSDEESIAESEERWEVVTNAIAMLKVATSASDLTAIINGEVVDITELTATATPEPTANYNTLSKGDESDEVEEMQYRLYELGYLTAEDVDGVFGTKTQTAVKMFQQVAGLDITGIADNETLTALYDDDAPGPDVATAEPTVEATEEAAEESDETTTISVTAEAEV